MNEIPLCNHVMPNGNTCGSPALRNQRFCYFHNEQRKRAVRSQRARQIQHHACPFHPDVVIRRKKCPLFLAMSVIPKPVPNVQSGELAALNPASLANSESSATANC